MLPLTVEAIDRDLRETSKRYDRAMANGELELADTYEKDIDLLLDRRNELMSNAIA